MMNVGLISRIARDWLPLILALSILGCFGRTPISGMGYVDGEQGDECFNDSQCRFGLICLHQVCVSIEQDSPGASIHPGSCPGFAGWAVVGPTLHGSTSGMSRYQGSCGGSAAPEDVWILEIDRTRSLAVSTRGSDFDTVVYVRDGCDPEAFEYGCNDDQSNQGLHSDLWLVDLPAGRYAIFIDGFGSGEGDYQFSIREIEPGADAP